jgi:carboxyl-terminal processing protease
MDKEKMRKYIRQAIVVVVSMMAGSIITMFIKDTNCVNTKTSYSKNSYKEFDTLFEAYDIIKENYYDTVDTDKLVDGAISGMLDSLGDQHTMYFDKTSKQEFDEQLSGEYYGIGAEIQLNEDKTVSIKKIFAESPAEKAGLKVNDIFVSIDGKSTEGKNASEVASMLKSSTVKTATIVVKRDGKEKTFKVKKENITTFSVSSEMMESNGKNVGYINVSIFGEKTYNQFKDALEKLEADNMDSLIIDLRGNSGGYLTTVTYMLNLFVDNGKVIYQMQTQKGTTEYKSTSNNNRSYDIVILVDNDSASASEIMSAAMREQYGAKLVGTTTYGKGTVQSTSDLSNGTMIKYTIEKWLTPSGECIDGVGITPDYEVELSEDYVNSPSNENDNQLQKALEILK